MTWASDWVGVASSSRLLTVSTSTPIRPSRPGSTSDAVPPAQSTTTFELGVPHPAHVHAAQQVVRVGLDHPGRVGQLGDLAGERPPVLLPGEHPLELARGGLGQVGALARPGR